MTAFAHDFRYAVRQLLRTPAFTAAAVITLALGIAVNTAFFAIVNAIVFRPMRAVALEGVYQPSLDSNRRSLMFAHFRLLEAKLPDGVESVAASAAPMLNDVIAHVPGHAERVQLLGVSGGHAAMFRLTPQAGRFISRDDDLGGVRAAVISDRLWREWFGGDRSIVERAVIRVDDAAYQVVGVAPPGYGGGVGFGGGNTDLWVPLSALKFDPRYDAFKVVSTFVRLTPGVSPEAASQRIRAAYAEADKAVPASRAIGALPLELHQARADSPFRTLGIVVLWLSSLVLIAACANLANMLFTRGVHRSAEMAVRQALGASNARLFRMLLIESAVVAGTATAIGLALALAATWQFNAAFPLFQDRVARVTIDLTPDYFVFLYAFGAGTAAAACVGVITAWRASRVPPLRGMAVGDAATSVTRTSRRTRLGLVALQVGAAVVLLMAGGLFYQQTHRAISGTLLFDTKPLAAARVDLSRHGYNLHTGQAFLRRLADGARALPGVEHAAIADGVPGGMYMGGAGVTFAAERTDLPFARYITTSHRRADGTLVSASHHYLRTLGLRLRAGRDLVEGDREGAALVVVISERMAEALWPRADPIGKRLMFGNDGYWRTVVGVFENPARRRDAGPRERLFDPGRLIVSPYDQRYPDTAEMAIARAQRSGDNPAAALARAEARARTLTPREMLILIRATDARGQLDPVRQAVSALDPNVAVFDAATVDESILAAMAPLRAGRLLLGALGFSALAIATLGIYSVVSFLVARRTREFGIRMALGAQRRQVVKMVVDDAVHLLLVGLFVGVFFYAAAERVLDNRTFGFMPNEVSTWVIVLVLILMVGLAAAFVPARRAASIDPNVALRDL